MHRNAMLSRRTLLTTAAATALAAACNPFRNLRAELHALLGDHFGDAIATHEHVKAFVADFEASLAAEHTALAPPPAGPALEARTLTAFFQSTTANQHLRKGEPLAYLGLFDPYTAPCQSQLVAEV